MRMLFDSNSTGTFSSTLTSDIFVCVTLSIMVVTTCFVIYALAGILAWSSNKLLPRVLQGSAFNVLFVSSAMVIATLLLGGIDLIGLLAMATEPINRIVENYAPVVVVGLGSTIMIIVVKWVRVA